MKKKTTRRAMSDVSERTFRSIPSLLFTSIQEKISNLNKMEVAKDERARVFFLVSRALIFFIGTRTTRIK
jgi:hypothetical protein